MSEIKNEFAFPRHSTQYVQQGMTMLDYFAGQALHGIAPMYTSKHDLVRDAYKIAEIMLEVRMEYVK